MTMIMSKSKQIIKTKPNTTAHVSLEVHGKRVDKYDWPAYKGTSEVWVATVPASTVTGEPLQEFGSLTITHTPTGKGAIHGVMYSHRNDAIELLTKLLREPKTEGEVAVRFAKLTGEEKSLIINYELHRLVEKKRRHV